MLVFIILFLETYSEEFVPLSSLTKENISQFFFTVIMPIYNTGAYIEEAVMSLVNQTIGFERIELILINDGSTDDSERVCVELSRKYPDNIRYISSSHKGASAARNIGLNYAHAKYINFLDSDDIWAADAFEMVYKFFEQNYNQVDVVAGRLRFYDLKTKYHPLDYKFGRTRVINLKKNFDCIQLSGASSFVKSSAIGPLRFSEELEVSEDFLFLNTVT